MSVWIAEHCETSPGEPTPYAALLEQGVMECSLQIKVLEFCNLEPYKSGILLISEMHLSCVFYYPDVKYLSFFES